MNKINIKAYPFDSKVKRCTQKCKGLSQLHNWGKTKANIYSVRMHIVGGSSRTFLDILNKHL